MTKKNKYVLTLVFIAIGCIVIVLIYRIYAPVEVNIAYDGIYYDFDDIDLNKSVKIIVNGTLSKDLWLRPKTFDGTILINSSRFEIIQSLQFGKTINTFSLALNSSEEGSVWKFYADNTLKHLGTEAYWFIYVDKTFSSITFVPMIGNTSSTQRIAAPCINRNDAISINRMLMSGGLSQN